MRTPCSQHFQSGVALVLSLLLLLVLTIVGVAAMNSTIMQERMAGNQRMQTQVFEVASEGVSRALEYYYDNAEELDKMVGHSDGLLCGFVHSGNESTEEIDDQLAWRYPEDGGFDVIQTGEETGLRLEQQMYCCRSWAELPDGEGGTFDIENPSKLFVLNRGTFLTGDDNDQSLAEREVEVRLDEADPGEPTCALCIPGGVDEFTAGTSNSFTMHGACGPAITAETAKDAGDIISGIDDKRIGNYDGGVTHGDMGPPWNNPNDLAEFIWWIKLGLGLADPDNGEYYGYWDHTVPEHADFLDNSNAFTGETVYDLGNREFGTQQGDDPDVYDGDPRITYFDHGVDMGGNATGHGIMIVNGTVEWGGTPDYDGLLVSVGGGFDVAGSGRGGSVGSMVFTKLEIANSDLEAVFGDDVAAAMGNNTPLPYEVAVDTDGSVLMYYPDDFEGGQEVRRAQPGGDLAGSEISQRHVPVRPVLRDDAGRQLIYWYDPDPENDLVEEDRHRFFRYTNGQEIDTETINVALDQGRIQFQDPTDPDTVVARIQPQSDLPRDNFGRLIPNFVPMPLAGARYNWPHEAIEYHPNRWGWGLCGDADDPEFCDDPPFAFGGSNFNWDGGGNASYTYDCRWLQRTRQRLLCEDQAKIVDGTEDFPPSGYEYDDPDYSMVCEHYEWATEYNEDVLELDGTLHNNHAWHLWDPSCQCLGVTRESDMILSGWRENLGWRDDDFAACAGLPGPSGDD